MFDFLNCKLKLSTKILILIPMSTLVSFVAFVYHIRRPQSRRFPDNFAAIFCGTLFGMLLVRSSRLLSNQREVQPDASGFYTFLCYAKAMGFQFFHTAFVWHWILSTITLYLVVVKKTPVNDLPIQSKVVLHY